jgi:hypothetical protein
LPSEVAALAAFEPATTPSFPWFSLDPSMHVASAAAWDVALPDLEVLERVATADGRAVRVRIRSARGAHRLHLHLPTGARIERVAVGARELASGFEKVHTQLFFAVPPEGVEVRLALEGAAPVRVHLLDQDWTLPDVLRPLQAARPATRVPRSDGDVSVLGRSFEL